MCSETCAHPVDVDVTQVTTTSGNSDDAILNSPSQTNMWTAAVDDDDEFIIFDLVRFLYSLLCNQYFD